MDKENCDIIDIFSNCDQHNFIVHIRSKVCIFIYLSIYLFIYSFIYLFIYFFGACDVCIKFLGIQSSFTVLIHMYKTCIT